MSTQLVAVNRFHALILDKLGISVKSWPRRFRPCLAHHFARQRWAKACGRCSADAQPAPAEAGAHRAANLACLGPLDRSTQSDPRNLRRTDIHEEASVKTKEQDDYGTAQTSIRHHPQQRSAMKEYAVAPIHTSGVALRHVGSPGCNLCPALDLDIKPPEPGCP